MLIRAAAFGLMEEQKVDNIDDLQIKCLFLWNPPIKDNDFSVFVIDDKIKTEKSDNVVIKMLASNYEKYKEGIQFFTLSEKYFLENQLNIEIDDEKKKCIHANIKNLKYRDFNNLIKYTFEHKDEFISYELKDIRDVISKLEQEDFNNFIDWYVKKDSNPKKDYKKDINEFVEKINNRYFRCEKNKLKYTR